MDKDAYFYGLNNNGNDQKSPQSILKHSTIEADKNCSCVSPKQNPFVTAPRRVVISSETLVNNIESDTESGVCSSTDYYNQQANDKFGDSDTCVCSKSNFYKRLNSFDKEDLNICEQTRDARILGGIQSTDACQQTRQRINMAADKFKAEVIPKRKLPKTKKCAIQPPEGEECRCECTTEDLCACGPPGEELLELLEGPEIVEAKQNFCWPDKATIKGKDSDSESEEEMCKQVQKKAVNISGNTRKSRQQYVRKSFFSCWMSVACVFLIFCVFIAAMAGLKTILN